MADSTLVIAPWMGNESVVGGVEWGIGSGLPDGSVSTWWHNASWAGGDNTDPPALRNYTTPFDALDAIITTLSNGTAFPSLKKITLVGFSAGAQLMSRYAFVSPLGVASTPAVKIVISDASSYLYFDTRRPSPDCRPLRDSGANASCSLFIVPPEAASCKAYNAWRYGVTKFSDRYTEHFNGDDAAIAAAVARFAQKDLLFVLGGADACNCNTANFINDVPFCFPAGGSLHCHPNAFGGTGCW